MSTKTNPAVAEYLARTQAALADLPAAEVEEIVEDIGQHLSEVAGELGDGVSVEALTERLGTPEQYASELRAAAGYPPSDGKPLHRNQTRFLARVALWSLMLALVVFFVAGIFLFELNNDALGPVLIFSIPLYVALIVIFSGRVPMSAVVELPEYQATAQAGRRIADGLPDNLVGYLRSVRPAWWLLRIVVLVAVCLLALSRNRTDEFVIAAAAAAILIWLGGRARRDGRWRWVVGPANAFAVGVAIALAVAVWASLTGTPYRNVGFDPYLTGLMHNGRHLSNVYVFGPDGKPLTEAYLYDENGQPLAVRFYGCPGTGDGGSTNKFPLPEVHYTDKGLCEESFRVPFTVAIPLSTPPTTSIAPTATTTPFPPQTTTGDPPPTTTAPVTPPTTK
jgi:uncharacterized membrane protein